MSKTPHTLSRRFSVAPMMDWTDRHCRFFLRQLSARALLYTEMVTADAVIHGDLEHLLGFDPAEHPIALQLGGSEPEKLAAATRIGAAHGYDEINLNVGCPSDRVQAGRFGAALMAEPDLVAQCFTAMKDAAGDVPVTIKCRIGIDDQDEQRDLDHFVRALVKAGLESLTVHARKAWLQGLSPKENRDIPPLNYPRVYQLEQDFPALEIIINGGIETLDEAQTHLTHVDGVMLGRAAYHKPWLLTQVDRALFGDDGPAPTRGQVVEAMTRYAENVGGPIHRIARHMLGLYQGEVGARVWRRHLSETMHKRGAGPEILIAAYEATEAVRSRQAA